MAKFMVACSWTVCKTVEIEAATEDEARQKALDDVEAEGGEYLDSSFEAFVLDEDGKETP